MPTKTKFTRMFALAAGIALSIASFPSASVMTAAPAKGSDLLDRDLNCLVDSGKIAGAVTLVARNGVLVNQSVVGFQDIASHTAMTMDTVVRIHSMSKAITSVAIMKLMEEGKLSLDDPVYKFIPGFKTMRVYLSGDLEHMVTEPAHRPIEIRDLLTHTSGLTSDFGGESPVQQYYRKFGVTAHRRRAGRAETDAPMPTTLKELVERLANAPLLHQPGERFEYGASTTVLGYIVEQASGIKFDAYLRERVFRPLRMKHTGFVVAEDDNKHFATEYFRDGTELEVFDAAANSDYHNRDRIFDGAGGLVSTALDYLRFAQMLVNGGELDGVRILKRETVKLMFQDHLPALAEGHGKGIPGIPANFQFGYGFAVGNAESAREFLFPEGAFGWDAAGNSFFWVDPGKKLVTIFMTDVITNASPQSLKKVVYRDVYGPENVTARRGCD